MSQSYGDVRLAICAPNASVRTGLKTALYADGFREINDTGSYAKLHDLFAENAVDLVVTADRIGDDDVCSLVHQMRNCRLGSNPFPLVIMLMSSADPAVVKSAANSGVDDLLLLPVAPAQVLARIALLADGRKPFVVTFDYIGPDRYSKEGQVRNPARQIVPPNPLRARIGRTGDTRFQEMILKGASHLNRMKVQCSGNQFVWLSTRIAAIIRDGGIDRKALAGYVTQLVATAEGLIPLLKSIGDGGQIAKVSDLLTTSRSVSAAPDQVALDVVEKMQAEAAAIGHALGEDDKDLQPMLVLTDEYRVGHSVIDGDHERLIEIINAFHAGASTQSEHEVLHQTLKKLLEYGREHFVREQNIQRECMYPDAVMHAMEHAEMLGQIKEMAKAYFVDKTIEMNSKALSDMSDFLNKWLMEHIAKFDLKMKKWVVR